VNTSHGGYRGNHAENSCWYSNRGIGRIYCDGYSRHDTPASAQPFEVVAEGLDSPRHLTFSASGDLYVVEAGRGGGPENCVEHPDLGLFCLGFTGAVTQVRDVGDEMSES
jgi:hypothetical protein